MTAYTTVCFNGHWICWCHTCFYFAVCFWCSWSIAVLAGQNVVSVEWLAVVLPAVGIVTQVSSLHRSFHIKKEMLPFYLCGISFLSSCSFLVCMYVLSSLCHFFSFYCWEISDVIMKNKEMEEIHTKYVHTQHLNILPSYFSFFSLWL